MFRRTFALLLFLLLASCPAPGFRALADEVSLATLDWEPYIGPNLVEGGYVAAIVREALARSGLTVRLSFLPWKRSVEMTRQGSFQAYFPEYHDPLLERDFAFSDPIPGGPLALFVRPGQGFEYNSPEDLRGKHVGLVRGYVNTPAIDGCPWLDRDEAASDLENLRKLLAGRVDVTVTDAYVARDLARRSLGGEEKVELLAVLEHKQLYFCVPHVRPDHNALLEAFNTGLAALRRDGTLRRIMDRHGFRAPGEAPPGQRP